VYFVKIKNARLLFKIGGVNLAALTLLSCASTAPTLTIDPNTIAGALPLSKICNGVVINYNNLDDNEINKVCDTLMAANINFHQRLNSLNRPVFDDHNDTLNVNIYGSRVQFVKLANVHFNVPTDNSGLYVEGKSGQHTNISKIVTYVENGSVKNLVHEYAHYLDGRFNLFGDYCQGLHDDHSAPNFCQRETPAYPHLVWWSEGLAEIITFGKNNPKAIVIAKEKSYRLSDIFNTSYNRNGGNERVYIYSYLAVRFMLDNHKNRVDRVMNLVRAGEYKAYQEMVRSWGRSMDQDFSKWLTALEK